MKAVLAILLSILLGGSGKLVVGEDFPMEEVTEFWYTYDATSSMGEYQRYRFYTEDGVRYFFHEYHPFLPYGSREEPEGSVSGTVALTAEEWEELLNLVQGGTVEARQEHLEDGAAGPWLFLYWQGDGSSVQEYTFLSAKQQAAFIAFCEELKSRQA